MRRFLSIVGAMGALAQSSLATESVTTIRTANFELEKGVIQVAPGSVFDVISVDGPYLRVTYRKLRGRVKIEDTNAPEALVASLSTKAEKGPRATAPGGAPATASAERTPAKSMYGKAVEKARAAITNVRKNEVSVSNEVIEAASAKK
jgi:hypothetical protein